jgi:hypothetical protein
MLIKAALRRDRLNAMYPGLPTSIGNNIASYVIIVRQDGVVIDGQYTLRDVRESDYRYVTCIYYNIDDVEIARSATAAKPGFCTVSGADMPGVKKLEMRVIGTFSAPTGGSIAVDGSYAPTGSILDYDRIFGDTDAELCPKMRINSFNMPSEQIRIDPNNGALIWNIAPKRYQLNSFVRLDKVVVETMDGNIRRIMVSPYGRRTDGQLIQLTSIEGVANLPITDFPHDYNVDIVFFVVTMFPFDFGNAVDPNRVTVVVDYCSIIKNPNALPMLNGIQPYYIQNIDNGFNQMPRMFTSIFLNIFY